jgi:LysM repeat protein
VRKWTKSACVMAALGIVLLLAVVGLGDSALHAQANITIASSTQAVPASAPASLMTVSTQAVPASVPAILMSVTAASAAARPPVTWVVRPGDTLSGIAAALGVRGGWQALYAANRRVIGPDPGLIRPGTVLTLPGQQQPASYTVAPGDTLSAIAAALGVRGGWQALYAANRRVIGPDPGLIRPETVLAVPPATATSKVPALTGTGPGSHRAPSSPGARRGPAVGGTPPAPGTTGGTAGAGAASPGGTAGARGTSPGAASRGGTGEAGVMPHWLKATLLAVGVLTVISFLAQPAVTAGQRRRRAAVARAAAGQRDRARRAAARMAKIVQADHERLIVTYSVKDDTVYVLTPPGEDPRAVLRAARLILHEDTYQDLADHLGVPAGWRLE